jgi:hypothetical protein
LIRNNVTEVINEEEAITILFLLIIILIFLFQQIHCSFWSQALLVGEIKAHKKWEEETKVGGEIFYEGDVKIPLNIAKGMVNFYIICNYVEGHRDRP